MAGAVSADPCRRLRGDGGFAGTLAGVSLGFLVFLAGTLMIANAWGVVDTKSATTEAARAAARSYVQASDPAAAAEDATNAAASALSGFGRSPARARITLVSGTLSRCARVTFAVSYPAPLLVLPFVGSLGSAETVRSVNSQLVGPYVSGLPGAASCA
jgi:hypothetical protein